VPPADPPSSARRRPSQLGLSVNQKRSRNLFASFDWRNVNNALLHYYQGVSNQPLQEEHSQPWMNVGINMDL